MEIILILQVHVRIRNDTCKCMAHTKSSMTSDQNLGIPDAWWEMQQTAMLKGLKTSLTAFQAYLRLALTSGLGWICIFSGHGLCQGRYTFPNVRTDCPLIVLVLQDQRWMLNVSCQMNELWKYKSKTIHVALGIAHLQNLICYYIDIVPHFIY